MICPTFTYRQCNLGCCVKVCLDSLLLSHFSISFCLTSSYRPPRSVTVSIFFSCTQSPFFYFFHYLFILSLSNTLPAFPPCSLFHSHSPHYFCSFHKPPFLIPLLPLGLGPRLLPHLPFPLSEWRERILYAPSVAPRFTVARAQNWLEFFWPCCRGAGISRRRPQPTWHRMPPFPLTGTPPADTALAESWEQWGPSNLPALLHLSFRL